jgi:hypothetical protein
MSPKLSPESIPQLDINSDAPKFVRGGDNDEIYWENPPVDHKGIIARYGIKEAHDAGNMGQDGDEIMVWGNSYELPLGNNRDEREETTKQVKGITGKEANSY